jgi:hypothetical protein
MKKAINKKDIKIVNPILPERAIIFIDNGICSLEADVDVMGIQLEFIGKVEITPDLPEGWILQGNNNTIIMFSLQGNPIQNQTLFSYKGNINIVKAIVSNNKGQRLSDKIKKSNPDWALQSFDFSIDTSKWEDYKDTKRVGKVNRTRYNLPNYDLPKVEKQIKTRSRTTTTTKPTYKSGNGSSGGY